MAAVSCRVPQFTQTPKAALSSLDEVDPELRAMFDKLGISSRVELVLYAVNHGGRLQAEWIPGLGN